MAKTQIKRSTDKAFTLIELLVVMKNLILISSVSVFCALVFGCGKGPKLTAADQKAFANAAPDIKQSWVVAQAAAATNDYVQAILTLRSLLGPALSVEQIEAVQNAITAYDTKLVNAASHGDTEAQKQLDTLRSAATRRGR
jgi:hypothetical protein